MTVKVVVVVRPVLSASRKAQLAKREGVEK